MREICFCLMLIFGYSVYSQDLKIDNKPQFVESFVTDSDSSKIFFTTEIDGIKHVSYLSKNSIDRIYMVSQERDLKRFNEGSYMLSLTGSFIKATSDAAYSMSLSGTYSYFSLDKLFLGFSAMFNYQSFEPLNSQVYGLGPSIGYVILDRPVSPYISTGIMLEILRGKTLKANFDGYGLRRTVEDYDKVGFDYYLGAGIIVPMQNSVGMIVECQYHLQKIGDQKIIKIIGVGIGLTGLFN